MPPYNQSGLKFTKKVNTWPILRVSFHLPFKTVPSPTIPSKLKTLSYGSACAIHVPRSATRQLMLVPGKVRNIQNWPKCFNKILPLNVRNWKVINIGSSLDTTNHVQTPQIICIHLYPPNGSISHERFLLPLSWTGCKPSGVLHCSFQSSRISYWSDCPSTSLY